jgi:hypothetical protein
MKLGEVQPPIFIDTKMAIPMIVINDPNLIEEIFVTKNKILDKHSIGK